MFATLAGGYPATDPGSRPDRPVDALVRAILAEQVEAGLALLTDGSLRWPDQVDVLGRALLETDPGGPRRDGPLTVDAWAFAADAAGGVPVKQCLPGPYSLGRRFAGARAGAGRPHPGLRRRPGPRAGRPGRGRLSVHPGRRGRRGVDRRRPARASSLPGRPGPAPRRPRSGRGSAPPVPGDQRRQRRPGWTGHDLLGAVRQPPVRPHRRARQLAPGDRRAGRAGDRPRGRRRPLARAATTWRSSCGPSATRRPVAVAARRGSGSLHRAAWRACPGRRPGPRSSGSGRSSGWSTGGPRNQSRPRSIRGPWTPGARRWAAGRRVAGGAGREAAADVVVRTPACLWFGRTVSRCAFNLIPHASGATIGVHLCRPVSSGGASIPVSHG